MMAQKKKHTGGARRKSNTGFSAVLWALAFLVVLILFVLLLPRIRYSIEQTDFLSHIGLAPSLTESAGESGSATPDGGLEAERGQDSPPAAEAAPAKPEQNAPPPSGIALQIPAESPAPVPAVPQPPVSEAPAIQSATAPRPEAQERAQETRQPVVAVPTGQTQLKVWFVEIQTDGSVSRKEIVRDFPATDSPLTAAIRALLTGPNTSERGKGCDTLVPEGTRLLSATVRNGVATLNFSDEFQYNRYGVEGYMGQLMQVVYTATAFPTVDSVQFLIEGERGEYLGSEGVWIGSPLSRSSFR